MIILEATDLLIPKELPNFYIFPSSVFFAYYPHQINVAVPCFLTEIRS